MNKKCYLCRPVQQFQARVAELVDASVSKTDERKFVPVRFRPRVQKASHLRGFPRFVVTFVVTF